MSTRLLRILGIVILAALAALAIAMLVPSSRYSIIGHLRGEAFYLGMPTSYWVRELGSEDPKARAHAAGCLGHVTPMSEDVVPALIAVLGDKNLEVRHDACQSLDFIARRNPKGVLPFLPNLCEALRDEDWTVRHTAGRVFFDLGPQAKEALPDLLRATLDKHNEVRIITKGAIEEMGLAALPGLRTALENKDAGIRRNAAELLGRVGGQVRLAVPHLRKLLEDADEDVRESAAKALRAMEAGD